MVNKILVLGSRKELEDLNISQHNVYDHYDSKGCSFVFATLPEVDLNKLPLPYKTNEFDGVFASHVIEHTIPYQLIDLMKELNRITKPYSEITIYVPHSSNACALTHITHYTAFNSDKFNEICDNVSSWEKYLTGMFNLLESKITIPRRFFFCKWLDKGIYESWFARYFPAHEIKFVLRNIKGGEDK